MWQRDYDEAIDSVANLLGKNRDEILTDGSMTDAFITSK